MGIREGGKITILQGRWAFWKGAIAFYLFVYQGNFDHEPFL